MDEIKSEVVVKVLFFAKARELTGSRESVIKIAKNISYGNLKEKIIHNFKLESIGNTVILAVNERFIEQDEKLSISEKDEIAVNMENAKDIVKLQEEKLDVNSIVESVASANCGAISTFIGTTRDHFNNKKVLKLEYEAYEPMALKEIYNLCAKIRAQWNVQHIAIYHRLGDVPVMQASVVIAISSPHRQESLQAVQFAIDTLKASVPIWKKEVYENDTAEWKENKECPWAHSVAPKIESSNDCCAETPCLQKSSENEAKHVVKSEDSLQSNVDPNLSQIRATTEELNKRIDSFISIKRQQVGVVNVREFCCQQNPNEEDSNSCARVDAILIRRKDSKSHVKVHRVLNPWGPQTVDVSTLYKSNTANSTCNYTPVLEERISSTEKLIGINKPVPKDIYERLKKIENRILFLESISPEYKNFWITDDDDANTCRLVRKRTFSTAELDSKLHELEDRYVQKLK